MSLDAPPSYAQATGSSVGSDTPVSQSGGIPPKVRRSLDGEQRPLPAGWIRQYDPKSKHHFFVDTNAKPPRSIWRHPHEDETYLSTLSSEEREQIEDERTRWNEVHPQSTGSAEAVKKRFEGDEKNSQHPPQYVTGAAAGATATGAAAAAGPNGSNMPPPKGVKKFGRSLKDKLTGTTHEQREHERRERDLQEQREYEMHQRVRHAMARAAQTGEPQMIGRDANGKDVYVEPPYYGPPGGFNQYQRGHYNNPNVVYVRPNYGYGYDRSYDRGFGLGLPILGGILGGALLGGLLF